jgi:hypothetical protein
MFNSWMFYIIFGLSATVGALGWLSLSLHDDKVIAVEALKEAKESIAGYQKALNLKYLSCQIDDASVVEVEKEKKQIDEVISPINSQLKDLATVKKPVTQVVVKPTGLTPKQNETIKDESNFLPDDGLLSPNVTRLLNDGWCAVYPSTSQCIPTGQLAGKSM